MSGIIKIVEQWGYWCVFKLFQSLYSANCCRCLLDIKLLGYFYSQVIWYLGLHPRESLPCVLKYRDLLIVAFNFVVVIQWFKWINWSNMYWPRKFQKLSRIKQIAKCDIIYTYMYKKRERKGAGYLYRIWNLLNIAVLLIDIYIWVKFWNADQWFKADSLWWFLLGKEGRKDTGLGRIT